MCPFFAILWSVVVCSTQCACEIVRLCSTQCEIAYNFVLSRLAAPLPVRLAFFLSPLIFSPPKLSKLPSLLQMRFSPLQEKRLGKIGPQGRRKCMTRPRNGCAGLVELESNERGSPMLETISMPTPTAASSRPKPPFLSEWVWPGHKCKYKFRFTWCAANNNKDEDQNA